MAEGEIVAGCLCGKPIHVCGDCYGLMGTLEAQMGLPRTYPKPVSAVPPSGWCAPSACATGICREEDEHSPDCLGPGWAYRQWSHSAPTEPLAEPLAPIELTRGPIWRAFRVLVRAYPRRDGFLWRERWYVDVLEYRGERALHTHLGPFSAAVATQVEKALNDMVAMHNDVHDELMHGRRP